VKKDDPAMMVVLVFLSAKAFASAGVERLINSSKYLITRSIFQKWIPPLLRWNVAAVILNRDPAGVGYFGFN
jgi:hypothetical protein